MVFRGNDQRDHDRLLQQSFIRLFTCLTPIAVRFGPLTALDSRIITLGSGDAVRLTRTDRRDPFIWFGARLTVQLTAQPGLRIVSYHYHVALEADRVEGPELFAYHWHPAAGGNAPNFPHLHISAGAARGPLHPLLQRAHLPTGPLGPAAIVRLLLDQLTVRPPPRRLARRARPGARGRAGRWLARR